MQILSQPILEAIECGIWCGKCFPGFMMMLWFSRGTILADFARRVTRYQFGLARSPLKKSG